MLFSMGAFGFAAGPVPWIHCRWRSRGITVPSNFAARASPTVIDVPGCSPASSTFRNLPPAISMRVPAEFLSCELTSGGRVSRVSRDTEAIADVRDGLSHTAAFSEHPLGDFSNAVSSPTDTSPCFHNRLSATAIPLLSLTTKYAECSPEDQGGGKLRQASDFRFA